MNLESLGSHGITKVGSPGIAIGVAQVILCVTWAGLRHGDC